MLSVPLSIYGDALQSARDAVEGGDYQTAISLLLMYLDEFPDRIDGVEQLIAVITTQTVKQRRSVERLVDQVEQNPKDLTALQNAAIAVQQTSTATGIDLQLDAASLERVSITAQEYQELDAILDNVGRHARAQRFIAATDLLVTALAVGQQRFVDIAGSQTRTTTLALAADIEQAAEQFRQEYNQQLLPSARRAQGAAGAIQPQLIVERSTAVAAAATRLDALLANLDSVAQRLTALQDDEAPIAYITILLRVATLSYSRESALPAIIERALTYEIDNIIDRYEQAFARRWQSVLTAMANERITVATTELAITDALARSLLTLWPLTIPARPRPTTQTIANLAGQDRDRAAAALAYYGYQSATELFRQLLNTATAYAPSLIQAADTDLNTAIENQNADYQRHIGQWQLIEQDIAALNQRIDNDEARQFINRVSTNAQGFIDRRNSRHADRYDRFFAETIARYIPVVQAAEAAIGESRELISGSQRSVTATALDKKYPAVALDILNEQIPVLEEALQELTTLDALYAAAGSSVRIRTGNELDALLAQVVAVDNTLRALQAEAASNIAAATQLRAAGDRLRAQAESALRQKAGRNASELWNQSRANYLDALALQEDEQFRQEIESITIAIQERIVEIEHAAVIREVRELLNRSRRAILVQDIDGAYSLIEEATQLWALTNTTANPEIVRQQEYLELALTFEQTYNLTIDDPLYAVLSGYLNNASTRIDTIGSLVSQNRTAEADTLTPETEQMIQNVLDVQPFNTEARILNLRLIDARGVVDTEQAVAELYANALRLADQEPRQSLSDFYTVRAVRPVYRDVERQIATLEIALGIRIPEANLANQAQAQELFGRARTLIATGDSNRRAAAETLLQQALTLNPNDSAVQAALDQLRIDSGSTVAAALSLNDEQLLRRAETLFVQGNIAQTFVILETLWQTVANRDYPPLITLRRQVISRLGI